MDGKRKCFTFIWKIKNFRSSFHRIIYFDSPIFFVHEIDRSKWNCRCYWCSEIDTDIYDDATPTFLACTLCREYSEYSDGPVKVELDYELSFLTGDGSVIHSELFRNKAYIKDYEDGDSSLRAEVFDMFVDKDHLFLPDDTLTVRCRMWKSQGTMSESVRCTVATRFNSECTSFDGVIGTFSSLKTKSKNSMCIKPTDKELPFTSMNLLISDNGELCIQIMPCEYFNTKFMHKLEVFILDVFKNKVKSCDGEIYDNPPFYIPLTFSMKRLIRNKERYLPDDVLTLQCKFTNSVCSIEPEKIDDMVYDYDCEDIQAAVTNARNTSSSSPSGKELEKIEDMSYDCEDMQAAITNATNTNSSIEHHTKSLTTLMDDLISFFSEGILYDTKLKTFTETFPAHSVVLSARSPVFKSMFATDMREKTKGCIDIEDLDANTVRQMLLFMYKDTLDDLYYEGAKSLYFAADKYNIVSLRHKCSKFLKQELQHSNCCEVLLLADKHQDIDLKTSVQDYIEKNDEAILSSDEWKDLEENHSRLTIEILRTLYMKNRKT
ncbi:TD and POZ domain-containing protein 1 [Araneus ventricosus]|uniref:TD and POZ domain-containing protein 1 n=1 Tax=Araneus ventricosus TaxID=182803 RepID=A0A4Y2IVL8_ARAVE|nr:TD and POZ domain-containing protein 1 [Araneus ventricosus]